MQILPTSIMDEFSTCLSPSAEPSVVSSVPSIDGNLLFDLSPLPLTVLSPSCCIARVSNRFLHDWQVSRDECIGQQLVAFLDKFLRPASTTAILHLTAAIDDAVSSRAERTSKLITTKHASSWHGRVLPIFKEAELLAIILEWQEGPTPLMDGGEIVRPGLSTDEAFRILVQAVKDYAIFLLDTKGHIATWNTGAELLKGYRREEIIGKHFSLFYGHDDLAIRKPELELEICLREGRVEDEGWRYKKDGTRFWANVIITAVYKDGVHVGFGKVTRDLTERKTAESRLITAYEESEKLKSDFLANMSHEIRTPMHGMLSACSLLLDTPLTERQQDIVQIMDESGQVLLQVINDILDYSKLASGTFSITSDIVGITSIITSVVRSVQTTVRAGVHFELFLATDLPKSVQGDPLRYRQILHNLVSNAAKFTEKGTIRIRATVQKEDEESYAVLTEVVDTGIGIPESAAAGLFTPFTQFDATKTKRYKGTGLGLSIAKSLAELMGGRIGYRPNPERHGSVFWFSARFKKIKSLEQIQDWKRKMSTSRDGSPMPHSTTAPADLQAELAKAASKKSLLLAEDNIINQKVMIGMLRSIGFKNVALAANGTEAVNLVRGKPAAFDLVLMDINMPILDGHEATVQIRKSGIRVPIVAMTAYALKGDKERCLEHGMDDYIPKPVEKQYLIKVLCKWLLTAKDYRMSAQEEIGRVQELKSQLQPALSMLKLPLPLPIIPSTRNLPLPLHQFSLPPKLIPSPSPGLQQSRPPEVPPLVLPLAECPTKVPAPQASPPALASQASEVPTPPQHQNDEPPIPSIPDAPLPTSLKPADLPTPQPSPFQDGEQESSMLHEGEPTEPLKAQPTVPTDVIQTGPPQQSEDLAEPLKQQSSPETEATPSLPVTTPALPAQEAAVESSSSGQHQEEVKEDGPAC